MRRAGSAPKGVWLVLLLAGVIGAMAGAPPSYAGAPAWSLEAVSQPTNFTPSDNGSGADNYAITLTNRGAGPTDGSPITIVDDLPAGFTVNPAGAFGEGVVGYAARASEGSNVSCGASLPVTCTFTGMVEPAGSVTIFLGVNVPAGAPSTVVNTVTVSGGGVASKSVSEPTTISANRAGFGVQFFDAWATDEDGLPDTQAGSHPYEASTSFNLNTVPGDNAYSNEFGWHTAGSGGGDVRDVRVDLPPGLIGDPSAVPQCTQQQFHTHPPGVAGMFEGLTECPNAAAVGVVSLKLGGLPGTYYPIWNLVPPPGMAASFGFSVARVPIVLNASVRSGGDYGVQIDVPDISQAFAVTGTYFTFWGVPGDPTHDQLRGACVDEPQPGGCPSGLPLPLKPFLTLPTACLGPQTTSIQADPWAAPGEWSGLSSVSHDDGGSPIGLSGCGRLDFTPQLSVAPDGSSGSTPSGLGVVVHVPQNRLLVATSLAESTVKDTTVALPAGMTLNPAAADGLQACSEAQIGFTGLNQQSGVEEFSPNDPSCPDASKIATVRIKTPLLPNQLEGAVYLAAPQNFSGPLTENPFGSLIAMYIVAKDPVSGVLVKLPGRVLPDAVSGQLVSTFENTPQLPFEELELHFFGSARAPLSTPPSCGTYTTATSIAPWSGGEPASPSSSFQITSSPGGMPCSDPQPFSPGFQAGSTNLQAGAFTPFTLTMTRPDADQTLGRVEMQMPPGLLGTLASVKLCPEPQASQGTCGEESLIGHTIVSAGLGGDPYTVTGGKVFITTGYKGAPYGLSVVNPAAAGPFVLNEGRPIVVRASINVDPHTAALTIESDPLPTILDGIPLQIQHVNVSIDRDKFTFNPTNCSKMAIDGILSSSAGTSAGVSTPFQVTNCATLAFKPKLTATTSGRTSRAIGASLGVKLTYPSGPFDANISKVKVDLPKQLPSRLTTLQKACVAAVFEANPANCPKGSIVGQARAITPVLPVPLTGPAYFVSHGGEAFPSLIIVLQGYGVRVDLVGATFISRAGITSSTFKTVPDVPVGTFELTLPTGRYSALAANLPAKAHGSFCGQTLAMPTAFAGQNGAQVHGSTKIVPTDCPKTRKARRHRRKGGGTSDKSRHAVRIRAGK
ncbi:MAG TPA: hypothetical protein VGG98_11445 [Solirubrobacteraceae bacterium]